MTTTHRTASGFVTLISEWGHGKGLMPNTNRPATLITDDGDGHSQQWSYTGRLQDALETLANKERAILSGDHVAIRSGAGYSVTTAPDDFWIEQDGEMVPNLAAYPNVIAY